MRQVSVGDAAKLIGCRPRDISDGFYQGVLDQSRIAVVGGRRIIPLDYVAEIRQILTARGKAAVSETAR